MKITTNMKYSILSFFNDNNYTLDTFGRLHQFHKWHRGTGATHHPWCLSPRLKMLCNIITFCWTDTAQRLYIEQMLLQFVIRKTAKTWEVSMTLWPLMLGYPLSAYCLVSLTLRLVKLTIIYRGKFSDVHIFTIRWFDNVNHAKSATQYDRKEVLL